VTLAEVRAAPASDIVKHYLSSFGLGAIILGLLVAVPAGFIAAWQMRRHQRNPKPMLDDQALEAFDDALVRLPRRYRHYAAWKLRLDPVYPMVVPKLKGRREVVDLGAGMGLLAFFLRAASPQTKVRCVEWDAEKANVARALLNAQADVVTADARTADLGRPDAIVLMDVLHYTPIEEQRACLDRCVAALDADGLLLVRELDPEASATSARIEQRAVKSGWNKGGGVHPWPLSQMQAHLESKGLEVTRAPAGKGFFRANALLVARKLP
jgi:2-polyprenyl-3-methyl-5-hydroxy-6-metoxy-1,4-benzoquinol methylase